MAEKSPFGEKEQSPFDNRNEWHSNDSIKFQERYYIARCFMSIRSETSPEMNFYLQFEK